MFLISLFIVSYLVVVIADLILTSYYYEKIGARLGILDVLLSIIPVVNLGSLIGTVINIIREGK